MTQPLPSPTQPIHKTQRFEDFYRLFQDKPGIFKYQDQINKIIDEGGNTLIILYEDLLSFDPQIAELLRDNPESLLDDAIEAYKNVIKLQSGSLSNQKYFVRIAVLRLSLSMAHIKGGLVTGAKHASVNSRLTIPYST